MWISVWCFQAAGQWYQTLHFLCFFFTGHTKSSGHFTFHLYPASTVNMKTTICWKQEKKRNHQNRRIRDSIEAYVVEVWKTQAEWMTHLQLETTFPWEYCGPSNNSVLFNLEDSTLWTCIFPCTCLQTQMELKRKYVHIMQTTLICLFFQYLPPFLNFVELFFILIFFHLTRQEKTG